MIEPVPHPWAGDGLLGQDLASKPDIEPPEVDKLARRIYLGLLHALRLTQHRCGGDLLAPRSRQEVRSPKQNGCAFVERCCRPVRRRGERSVDRSARVMCGRIRQCAQHLVMRVWLDHRDRGTRTTGMCAADDVGELDRVGRTHLGQGGHDP